MSELKQSGTDLTRSGADAAPELAARLRALTSARVGLGRTGVSLETRDLLDPFVDTLLYLHGKGFAHGRIKPGNILAIEDQNDVCSAQLVARHKARTMAREVNSPLGRRRDGVVGRRAARFRMNSS